MDVQVYRAPNKTTVIAGQERPLARFLFIPVGKDLGEMREAHEDIRDLGDLDDLGNRTLVEGQAITFLGRTDKAMRVIKSDGYYIHETR